MDKGLLKALSTLSRPVTARLGLPDTVIAASIVAFGSVLSANAILAELYHKQQVSEKETYLGAILNGTSLNVRQIFTYQLPVMLPLLGWKAGGIYLLCFCSAAVIRYAYVFFYARRGRQFHKLESSTAAVTHVPEEKSSIQKQTRLFLKIAITYLVITFCVMFVFNAGASVWFEQMVAPVNAVLQLPVELAVPMAIFIFNPVAGAAAVGSLRSSGSVTDIDAVLAVIVGSLLLLPIYGFRSGTIARTISFFGPKLGLRISTTSTVLALVSRLIFLVLLMLYKLTAQ